MRKSFWWLVILCFVIWGPLDGLPCIGNVRSAPVAPTSAAASMKVCQCSHCMGGKQCCCRPTRSLAEALRMTARCADPTSAAPIAKYRPLLLPRIAFTLLPAAADRVYDTRIDPALRVNTVAPTAPPPRPS